MDPLPDNFQMLPEWIKHAYYNDTAVNRIVKDWRMTGAPVLSLYERLALRSFLTDLADTGEATFVSE